MVDIIETCLNEETLEVTVNSLTEEISVTQVTADCIEVTLSGSGIGGGDYMLKSIYDPTNVSGDVFSMGNMVETATELILTDVERDKLSNISITQAVDLDQIELDVAANNLKVSNVDTALSIGTQTGTTLAISSEATPDDVILPEAIAGGNAGLFSGADKGKLDLISVTIPVDLDTGLITPADKAKLDFISVTQAVDLDQMESDIAVNNAKVSNVPTSLSIGTQTGTTLGIDSDGSSDDVILPEAVASGNAGLLSGVDKDKLDSVEYNAEQNNITDIQATDLTDGNSSSLHFHASDRNRANHTGTQLANTISDFDVAVSANADVAANTAARHDPITLNAGDATQESASLVGQELELNKATPTTDGVMSSEDKVKLNGIEALAEVNNISDANAAELIGAANTTLHFHASDRDRSNHTGIQAASTIFDFDFEVQNNPDVAANTVARHDAVTLNAGDTTQETLSLATQEITVNLATPTTDGAMSAADKAKLDTISGGVAGAVRVIGFWNANTNTPDLSALTLDQGQAYQVSVAGTTNLNGESSWAVNDLAVWNDSLAGNYFKIDNTDDVKSVNGYTGAIVLDPDDLDDAATLHKFASQAQLDKIDFITITQAVNLDTLESDVALNTADRHVAVTVLDTAEIDLTLVGQQISASIVAGSIDEVKLDASVNASLDLADSALQSGDNVSELTNDAGYITSAGAPVQSVNAQTGIVVLDADDISDAATTNKFVTQAQIDDFHVPVTVLDTAEIDLTLTGQQISASIVAGSIDESKLDASVNASLDLADSALQSGDNVSELTNDAGYITIGDVPAAPVTSVNGETGVVVLDADDISDAATTNKFATQAQLDKVDFLTVTQAVDLDTLESDVALNNAKVSNVDTALSIGTQTGTTLAISSEATPDDVVLPQAIASGNAGLMSGADKTKIDFLTVTQAVDLDTLESDVALNNASRHDPVTVLDTAEIDLTLTGQQISASIVAASIDESKLDASVNASLDLADSALQSGDNVSELTNDAGYITSAGAPVQSVNAQTGVVVLDADDISDAATTNKFATQAQLDKVDFLTITQAVDLDTLESDVAANNLKVSNVPTSLSIGTQTGTTLAITSDGAVDDVVLPQVIAAGNAGLMSGADKTKLDGIEAGAEVNDDTLQDVYDRGNTIDVTAANGTVELDNTGETIPAFRIVPNAAFPSTGLAGGAIHLDSDGTPYSYDSTRSKMLSISDTLVNFASNGGTDDEYLRVGFMFNVNSGHVMPRDGTIVMVTADSNSGNATKGFDIEVNGTSQGSFNMVANQYTSDTTDIDFSAGDRLQVFCQAAGGNVNNPTVNLFVKWRK